MNPLGPVDDDALNQLVLATWRNNTASSRQQQAMRQLLLNGGREEWQALQGGLPQANFPYTQISPKIGSHSNMPTVSPQTTMGGNAPTGPVAYDELGRRYPGLTPDEARANYVTPPGAYVSYNQAYPMPPMAPQPGQQSTPDRGYAQWLYNAMRNLVSP